MGLPDGWAGIHIQMINYYTEGVEEVVGGLSSPADDHEGRLSMSIYLSDGDASPLLFAELAMSIMLKYYMYASG